RRGVEGPADAPLPACDPTCQRLFLSKAEQGKLPDLTQILGDHIVGLRVCCVEVLLRRRGLHRGSACGGGFLPRALFERQRTEGVIVVRHRETRCVGVSACAQAWERFLGLRREPCPPLQRFWFVYSVHRYCSSRADSRPRSWRVGTVRSMIPARQSCRRRWVRVCHDGGRDGIWDPAHHLYTAT